MRINFNVSAVIANNQLESSDTKLAASMERLSSGLKINHAKDDPSGLAIAKRMNAQIRGLERAGMNAQDGMSVIETAEGALSEVQDMLQRMNELAIQSANGTMATQQRAYVQNEIDALSAEINRISRDTAFNGQGLLDGSLDLKSYCSDTSIACSYYSDEVKAKEYDITIDSIVVEDGEITDVTATLGTTEPNEFPEDAIAKWEGGKLVITGSGGFEMKIAVDEQSTTGTPITIDATGIGALRIQIGANEGQILDLRIPEVSLDNMGIKDLDVSSQEEARDSIAKITDAVDYISTTRSRLGAYQNRLQYTTSSLAVTSENMTGAHSRIMDVDMASEMTEYTTYQVMTQAGTSMLAQANERPQQVLQLLQ